jgi:16S rRNA (guanine527-N7)-methyltransferase
MNDQTECLFLKGKKSEDEINHASKKWAFDVKKIPSVSEESGMIIHLSNIQRK